MSHSPYSLEPFTYKKTTAGAPNPRGTQLKKDGVNFALFSRSAKAVYLLLFDSPDSGTPTDIIELAHRTGNVWHVYVHGVGAGQLYGYKVDGDYDPAQAMRFNKNKLLMDPYAKALTGKFKNVDNLLLGYDANSPDKDLTIDTRDNTHIVPKCIVIDDDFDWQNDQHPNIPEEKLVIYETHLKGFTADESSNVNHKGTYLGFIEKIEHLKNLGVNAVEFLPIHEFYSSDALSSKNLKEYWGYNTIGYFAPEVSYSTQEYLGSQVHEFKTMVRELHKAGIEVILDVVYNHSGEGNELGPTICFKGIDNSSFYALSGPEDAPYRYYEEYTTGCGNMLNLERASVRHGVIDSLRYWVEHMHVDGFRFDLAPALFREEGKFKKESPFLKAIADDPILRRVKMIAEPWDLSGHHYGGFPDEWLEWNDYFRNTMRRFIRGDGGQLKNLAHMLTGSKGFSQSKKMKSVNFITCHDGFTLNDLYSYNHKYNLANGENNRDGADHNESFNCGVEGTTDDEAVLALRRKLAKNAMCLLFFSFGMPMMLGGDEFLRTQKGNNNAYCQDNEINWFNWHEFERNQDIFAFVQKAILFRKRFAVLQDGHIRNDESVHIGWYGANGHFPHWESDDQRLLCWLVEDNWNNTKLFFVFNAHDEENLVKLPESDRPWKRVVDTHMPSGDDFRSLESAYQSEDIIEYRVPQMSVAVFVGG